MKNIPLRRRSWSKLFSFEGFAEHCSLVGHRWGTLSQCQFIAPYPQGRDRGYPFLLEVPPLLAQYFFISSSWEVYENFKFFCKVGSYLLLHLNKFG